MEEVFIGAAVIVYLVLLGFGFKATWHFAADTVLAGSSGILFPILLFIVMILVVGPFLGIVQIIKLLIAKGKKSKTDQNQ